MTWSVVPIPTKKKMLQKVTDNSENQQTDVYHCVSPTVHLHQELVEGLLLLCVGETGHVVGALLPHSVDLVNVDDARCSSTGLFKQTPDPGSTKTCTWTQWTSNPGLH